jgi:threonine dehydrogenase-like Zn-dependent dehydrogenase
MDNGSNRMVVVEGPGGAIGVEETSVPPVPEGGLLVRVERAGVCATDLHLWRGEVPGVGFPLSLGHELVGVVEKVGPFYGSDVLGRPVREGDRVVVMPATPCGVCPGCKISEGVPDCANWDVIGFSEPTLRPAGGGLARYVLCPSPKTRVFVTETSPDAAVLTEPAATPVEGLRRIGVELGDSVLVQGAGTVGLLAIAAAIGSGAGPVDAIGGPPRRLELAKELGARAVYDIAEVPDPEARSAEVLEGSPMGAGYDLVIECAGRPQTIPEGLGYVRKGGKYLELGHFSDVGNVEINPYRHLLARDVRLVASSGYTARSFLKALRLVEGLAPVMERLVTHRLPLERAGDALLALTPEGGWKLDGQEVGKISLDPWL